MIDDPPEPAAAVTADAPVAPSTRRVTLDIAVQLVAKVLNLALGVVVTVVLVRALGDVRFGQWSTVFSVAVILSYFGDLGLEQVTVRQAAQQPEITGRWLGSLISLRLLIAIPSGVLCAAVIAVLADDGDMRIAGAIVSVTVAISALASMRIVFQLRTRNDIKESIELSRGLIWAACVFAIAAIDGGIVAFAAAFTSVAVVISLAQAGIASRMTKVVFTAARSRWRELAVIGIPVGVSGLLMIAYARTGQVLIYQIAGDRAAGLYGSVNLMLERAHLLPAVLMTTLFPILAAAHGRDPARVRRIVQITAEYLLMASLPLLAFALVCAEPLVVALFGSDFAGAAPALVALMAAFVLICLGYLAGNMVVVLRLQRRFLIYAVVALVFNITANLLLLPSYGITAAAWVTAATELVVLAPTFRDVLRTIGLRPALGRFGRIVAAATAMALVLWGLRAVGAPLIGLAAAAAISYPLALFATRALRVNELKALLRRDASAM